MWKRRECPVCCGATTADWKREGIIRVYRCLRCKHRTAEHLNVPPLDRDYHEQYDQSSYLNSLRATRLRQAGQILKRLEAVAPVKDGLLDYGSGRGFLLEKARQIGLHKIAGAETSPIGLAQLRGQSVPAVALDEKDPCLLRGLDLLLPFEPRVISFLDVLEHFQGDPVRLLSDWLPAASSKLRALVVKVPVSDGFFYRVADLLRKLGMVEPLMQLYQVGTYPAHFHYYSKQSLSRLFGRLGLRVLDQWGDLDFEPATLLERLRFSLPVAPRMARFISRSASAMIEAGQLFDCRICILAVEECRLAISRLAA